MKRSNKLQLTLINRWVSVIYQMFLCHMLDWLYLNQMVCGVDYMHHFDLEQLALCALSPANFNISKRKTTSDTKLIKIFSLDTLIDNIVSPTFLPVFSYNISLFESRCISPSKPNAGIYFDFINIAVRWASVFSQNVTDCAFAKRH